MSEPLTRLQEAPQVLRPPSSGQCPYQITAAKPQLLSPPVPLHPVTGQCPYQITVLWQLLFILQRWWKRRAGVGEVCAGGGQRVGGGFFPPTTVHGLCTRWPQAIVHALAKRAGADLFSKQEAY